MSMARLFLPPALVKPFLARSTSTATSAGSGLTASVPDSIRATSSRSAARSCMWTAWSSTIRKNWRTTAGSRSVAEPRTVAAEPLMEGQRGAQLVADRRQELRPQPLNLLQRRHVLHGDDHRLQLTLSSGCSVMETTLTPLLMEHRLEGNGVLALSGEA